MSELIDNSRKRQELLKHLILQLHNGKAPAAVKKQLIRLLGEVPYGDVVKVEQELISEGLPSEEVLKLCDVHAEALKGAIDLSGAKKAAPGHPVYTFQQENIELKNRIETLGTVITEIHKMADEADSTAQMMKVRELFNELQDVEKHYLRKEHLLFPYLEKKGITGPPKVMWGKHDEARQLMKAAQEGFEGFEHIEAGEARALIEFIIQPAISAIDDMIYKEEQILFPMCLDTLNDIEWNEINQQSPELGFCLYVPEVTWEIENGETVQQESKSNGSILFPTGKMEIDELIAIFEAMPVDLTFVDKDDFVRFFSHGAGRIFERTLSVIGRKVQFCHPPSSVHIVQRILDDFRNDRQNKAAFWINLHGKFIHIEYIALRGSKGEYLGTLEVTQDLTEKRKLEGDRRLLEYEVEG